MQVRSIQSWREAVTEQPLPFVARSRRRHKPTREALLREGGRWLSARPRRPQPLTGGIFVLSVGNKLRAGGKVWYLTARAFSHMPHLAACMVVAHLHQPVAVTAIGHDYAKQAVQTHARRMSHTVPAAEAAARRQQAERGGMVAVVRMSSAPAPYDTIAAYIEPTRTLDDGMFEGGSIQETFTDTDSLVSARLWLNPAGDEYSPRVTYWRPHAIRKGAGLGNFSSVDERFDEYPNGLLKVECSIPKMARQSEPRNMTQGECDAALDHINSFVAVNFGDLPDVRDWKAQRVDYCWMWDVSPNLVAYMSVLNKLRIAGMDRHPFDADEGVVWKANNRWIKFYNKSKESRLKGQLLRYEVSNYKTATKYMASDQFGCERTVRNLLHSGRALYSLAAQWDKLGLGYSDSYGHEQLLDQRLRECYGKGVPAARYILYLMREYGSIAHDKSVNLTTRSTYYHWKSKLREDGFITIISTGDEDDDTHININHQSLPALHLPTTETFSFLAEMHNNVVVSTAAPPEDIEKNFREKLWSDLCGLLGLKQPKRVDYLIDRWLEYASA